jgi:hypothetical protein
MDINKQLLEVVLPHILAHSEINELPFGNYSHEGIKFNEIIINQFLDGTLLVSTSSSESYKCKHNNIWKDKLDWQAVVRQEEFEWKIIKNGCGCISFPEIHSLSRNWKEIIQFTALYWPMAKPVGMC